MTLDMGSSSHSGLNIGQGQKADRDNKADVVFYLL